MYFLLFKTDQKEYLKCNFIFYTSFFQYNSYIIDIYRFYTAIKYIYINNPIEQECFKLKKNYTQID